MTNERAYLMQRAAQERAAAEQARNRKAREAHLQMATRYEARAQEQPHSAEMA